MDMQFVQLAAASFPEIPVLAGVIALGFTAAVTIGSIAWYNSRRPAGWEDKERPGFIPKVK
ncbi:hypothetical protein C1752_07456 [Acaryochloris thomasi RCC1774]|uniref:Uncharacterized protein n=2 Tax=Acaryochloris TaxID=155977 RepID=A0A2W1JAL1_9CYAN|nr:hypothetical protein [Acaryochloris thomasi]PZD71180.1 hypothetical protein C1752_07456 [Acaryochloris thomasi RCC1774]